MDSQPTTTTAPGAQPCILCGATPTAYMILTSVLYQPADKEIVGYLCERCHKGYQSQHRATEPDTTATEGGA